MIRPASHARPPATFPRTIAAAALALFVLGTAPARAGGIVIDGRFDDWAGIAPAYERARAESPPAGEPAEARPVIEAVWVISDRDRLAVRFRLSRAISLQKDNALVLDLDTDLSGSTGAPPDGADLRWTFAGSEGRATVLGVPVRLTPAAVGLRQGPTVTSREFEVSFDRRASVAGAPILAGDSVAVVLRDQGPAPSSTGRLTVALSDRLPEAGPPPSLARRDPTDLRLLTYNVRFDGCFDRPEPFRRILRALDPDVVCFQEIYNHSPEEVRAWMAETLPGTEWRTAGDGGQGIVASRYPVRDSGPLGARRRGGWARIGTPEGDLLVVNPHPPCCNDDAGRQREFDAMIAWIRDGRRAGRLPANTPMVIAGDMNLVGDARQLATLTAGAIVDTAAFGPGAAPDGDRTPLEDAVPLHLTGRESYTWRNDRGSFAPGRLDYIVFSDSVLGLARSFVLWTPELPPAFLEASGLEPSDTAIASDHLPVVADFYFPGSSR